MVKTSRVGISGMKCYAQVMIVIATIETKGSRCVVNMSVIMLVTQSHHIIKKTLTANDLFPLKDKGTAKGNKEKGSLHAI
jgi:hypothetical protein